MAEQYPVTKINLKNGWVYSDTKYWLLSMFDSSSKKVIEGYMARYSAPSTGYVGFSSRSDELKREFVRLYPYIEVVRYTTVFRRPAQDVSLVPLGR